MEARKMDTYDGPMLTYTWNRGKGRLNIQLDRISWSPEMIKLISKTVRFADYVDEEHNADAYTDQIMASIARRMDGADEQLKKRMEKAMLAINKTEEKKMRKTAAKKPEPENKPVLKIEKPEPEKPEPEKPVEVKPVEPENPADAEKVPQLKGKGWEIVFDGALARTRVIFESKPALEVRAAVKEAGFWWNGTTKSWNRGLSKGAHKAALALAKELSAMLA